MKWQKRCAARPSSRGGRRCSGPWTRTVAEASRPQSTTTLVEETPSLFFAVPSAYRALLEHAPPDAAAACARIRRCVSAGEALPEAIFHEWRRRFGVEILDGLGSTETLHIFLSNTSGSCV